MVRFLAPVLLPVALSLPAAAACSPAARCASVQDNQVIFAGTVLGVEPRPDGSNLIFLRVREGYQNVPAGANVLRAVHPGMKARENWLVYATRGEDGELRVAECSPSRLLTDKTIEKSTDEYVVYLRGRAKGTAPASLSVQLNGTNEPGVLVAKGPHGEQRVEMKPGTPTTLQLAAGTYALTATAGKRESRREGLEMKAGACEELALSLGPLPETPAVAAAPAPPVVKKEEPQQEEPKPVAAPKPAVAVPAVAAKLPEPKSAEPKTLERKPAAKAVAVVKPLEVKAAPKPEPKPIPPAPKVAPVRVEPKVAIVTPSSLPAPEPTATVAAMPAPKRAETPKDRTVVVLVTTAEGTPAPNAQVTAVALGAPSAVLESASIAGRTDQNGSIQLKLQPGLDYRVDAIRVVAEPFAITKSNTYVLNHDAHLSELQLKLSKNALQ